MLNESNLRMIRTYYDLNQMELASLIGIKQPYIALVESGRRNLSENVRGKLIDALKLTPDKVAIISEHEANRRKIIDGTENA